MSDSGIYPPFDNMRFAVRYPVSGMWLISCLFSNLWIAMAADDLILSEVYSRFFFFSSMASTFIIHLSSYFIPNEIKSVRNVYLILGSVGLAFLICLVICFGIYFVVSYGFYKKIVFLVLVVIWVYQITRRLILLVKKDLLVEKYYVERDCYITLGSPLKEYDGIMFRGSFKNKKDNWIYLCFLFFAFHEFFVSGFYGGMESYLFKYWLISTLSSFLLIYALARFFQGFYICVFLPCCLERKTGKPVVFDDSLF